MNSNVNNEGPSRAASNRESFALYAMILTAVAVLAMGALTKSALLTGILAVALVVPVVLLFRGTVAITKRGIRISQDREPRSRRHEEP